jgi:zinc protease
MPARSSGSRGYLVPAKMKVIAVGDRGRVESQLKALGLGPIEVRSAQAEATR